MIVLICSGPVSTGRTRDLPALGCPGVGRLLPPTSYPPPSYPPPPFSYLLPSSSLLLPPTLFLPPTSYPPPPSYPPPSYSPTSYILPLPSYPPSYIFIYLYLSYIDYWAIYPNPSIFIFKSIYWSFYQYVDCLSSESHVLSDLRRHQRIKDQTFN